MIMLLQIQMVRLQIEDYPIPSRIFQVKRQNISYFRWTHKCFADFIGNII